MRCLNQRMPVTTEVAIAQIIGEDNNHIGRVSGLCHSKIRRQDRQENQEPKCTEIIHLFKIYDGSIIIDFSMTDLPTRILYQPRITLDLRLRYRPEIMLGAFKHTFLDDLSLVKSIGSETIRPRCLVIQAMHLRVVDDLSQPPSMQVEIPVCFKCKLDTALMPYTLTHLLLRQAFWQHRHTCTFPDPVYVFVHFLVGRSQ